MCKTSSPIDLISGRTAARLLGVAPATIGNRVARGELVPYARLENGIYLFDRLAIIAPGAPDDPTDYKGCSTCGGPTEGTADFCPDHPPDGSFS